MGTKSFLVTVRARQWAWQDHILFLLIDEQEEDPRCGQWVPVAKAWSSVVEEVYQPEALAAFQERNPGALLDLDPAACGG